MLVTGHGNEGTGNNGNKGTGKSRRCVYNRPHEMTTQQVQRRGRRSKGERKKLTVKLPLSEYNTIKAAATAHNLDLMEFMRQSALIVVKSKLELIHQPTTN